MNRLITFLFLIFISVSVAAGVYEDTRKDGIAAFNKGNYEYALKCFESVLRIAPANNDLAAWINKCKTKIENKKKQEQERRRREAEERNTYFTISPDSASFDWTGGNKTFTVSSSHPWKIQRYPEDWDWRHLTTTGNTIKLRVDANLGWPRTDYFLVSSESKTLRVGFSQDERLPIDVSVEPDYSVETPNVKLDSIRVKHYNNVKVRLDPMNEDDVHFMSKLERKREKKFWAEMEEYGYYYYKEYTGMQLSMKLHCNNINLDSCHIIVHFYDSEGESLKDDERMSLKDKYSRFVDAEGNVATEKTFYLPKASSAIDCTLSIPYFELHTREVGKKTIKYSITICDMSSGTPEIILKSPQYVTIFTAPFHTLMPFFHTEGTIKREYTDVDYALVKIREAIQEKGTCKHGALTTQMGVAVLNDSTFVQSSSVHKKIHYKLLNILCKLEKEKRLNEVTSIAMTNSGYYCLTYGGNSWYGVVPDEMSNKLKEFYKRGETIYCVSISENGSYAIVGNKSSYASNPEFMSIMEKAISGFGRIVDVCITNHGISLIGERGIYCHNICSKLEKEIKEIISTEIKGYGKKIPDHIRFTDDGTYLITYEKGDEWRLNL